MSTSNRVSRSLERNTCFFSDEPMRPWLDVPCDWRVPSTRASPSTLPERRSWRVYWADRSSFGWVWPRPTAAEIRAFSDVDHDTHDDTPLLEDVSLRERVLGRAAWALDRSVDMDDAWIATLERSVRGPGNTRPLRVLELGVGHGLLLRAFAARGHECIGVDPDPKAVAEARRLGLRALPGTAEELPPELAPRGGAPNTFDVVLLVHVLEHTRDPGLALDNAARLLRRGGALVVETPNAACAGARQAWAFFDVPRHLSFFTSTSLRSAVEHAGLVVERVEHCGYTRQFRRDRRDRRETERAIRARLAPATRRTFLDDVKLFARTALAPDEQRYDSVRILARKLSAR